MNVTLCEKGRVAGEQSSRNWGWVRQQGRDAAELPISMESNRLWQQLMKETGEDLASASMVFTIWLRKKKTSKAMRVFWNSPNSTSSIRGC